MAIDYGEINARAVNLLLSVEKHVSSIEDKLKALVELRVSQINGCAYCVDLHSIEARMAGELQQRLDCLSVWRESRFFTDREMAALNWAESVTNISAESDMESKLNQLLEKFSEVEAVDLTLIISLMNSLNRLAISFGDKPPLRNE
jgi:AhpD family alkylhydroperoxidase